MLCSELHLITLELTFDNGHCMDPAHKHHVAPQPSSPNDHDYLTHDYHERVRIDLQARSEIAYPIILNTIIIQEQNLKPKKFTLGSNSKV